LMYRVSASLELASFPKSNSGEKHLIILDLDDTVVSFFLKDRPPVLLDFFLPERIEALRRQNPDILFIGLTARDETSRGKTLETLESFNIKLHEVVFSTRNQVQYSKGSTLMQFLERWQIMPGLIHFFDDQPIHLSSVRSKIVQNVAQGHQLFKFFKGLHLHYSVAPFFFMRSGFQTSDLRQLAQSIATYTQNGASDVVHLFLSEATQKAAASLIGVYKDRLSITTISYNPANWEAELINSIPAKFTTLIFDSVLAAYYALNFLLEAKRVDLMKFNFSFGILTDPLNPVITFEEGKPLQMLKVEEILFPRLIREQ
jgi:hypothetical protein